MTMYRRLTAADGEALNLPNQKFELFGRLLVTYTADQWFSEEELYTTATAKKEMVFPDEHYRFAQIAEKGFAVGAFVRDTCRGLAVYQNTWNKYLYLADLKVNEEQRGMGIASGLIKAGLREALQREYLGLSTIAQDNNLAACRFYLKQGFEIGGLNTRNYRHTRQAGKQDIYFYLEGTDPL